MTKDRWKQGRRAITGLAIFGFAVFVLFELTGGLLGAGVGALISLLSKRKR